MTDRRSAGAAVRVQRSAIVEQLRASLWFVPALFVTGAVLVAALLNGIEVGKDSSLSGMLFPGGADSARAILQTIAGSVITVTGVVFSLTVVTLQLASTQFSPRLLRTFLRDISNQLVLGTFLATFAYCLVALRGVASATPDEPASVPAAAITGAFVLTAASVVALVYFIDHIARTIRIDSLMREVNEDTAAVITHLPEGHASPAPAAYEGERAVTAHRSGFVQAVDERRLLAAATAASATIRLEPRIGDRAVEGAPIAWLQLPSEHEDTTALERAVRRSVQIGYERTMQQDVAFGLRQLVDVAIKALSPGINDPTTAVHAIGHLAHLLTHIAAVQPGNRVICDDEGTPRLFVPARSFDDYLDLSCDQIRRYGAGEPAVTGELLRLIRDVARADHPGAHATAIRRQVDLIVRAAEQQTKEPKDVGPLHELRDEIREIVDEAERAVGG